MCSDKSLWWRPNKPSQVKLVTSGLCSLVAQTSSHDYDLSHWMNDTLHVLRCGGLVFKRTAPQGHPEPQMGHQTSPRSSLPHPPDTHLPICERYIHYPSSPHTWLKIRRPWLSPPLAVTPPPSPEPVQASHWGDHVTEVINGRSLSTTWHVAPAVSLLLWPYESLAGRVPVAGWPIRHCQRPPGDEWFRDTRRGWRVEVWAGRVLAVCSQRVCVCVCFRGGLMMNWPGIQIVDVQ